MNCRLEPLCAVEVELACGHALGGAVLTCGRHALELLDDCGVVSGGILCHVCYELMAAKVSGTRDLAEVRR